MVYYGADHLKYEGKETPARLLQKLETAGIPTKWVSEDVRAKELFDITTDRLPLISIPLTVDETRDRLTRLLYVAITRAKYRLVIPYTEETEFIDRFMACLTNL